MKKVIIELDVDASGAVKGVKNFEEQNKQSQEGVQKETKNTGTAVNTLSAKLDAMTGGAVSGLKRMLAGVKAGAVGFKSLKVAIASTGIGALLVAFGSLTTFFTKTQRGAEMLKRVTSALGATFDVLVDRFSSFGEAIIQAFQNPEQAVKDFADTLKEFVMNRVEDTINGFTGLGETIQLIFKGEFSEALKTGKDALIDLTTGLNPIAGIAKESADSIKGLVDEIKNESQAAFDLEKRMQELEKNEIDFIERRAKMRSEMEKYRLQAEDETLTDEERGEALRKSIRIQQELTDKEIEFAKERADIISKQVALGESTNEDLQAEAEAKARVLDLETQRDRMLRSLQTRLNAFTKGVNENTDAQKKNAESQKKLNEALKQQQQNILSNEQETIKKQQELEDAYLNSKLDKIDVEKNAVYDKYFSEIEAARQAGRDTTLLEEAQQAEIDAIDAKYARQKVEREQMVKNAKIAAAGQALQAIQANLEQGSKASKAVAIAQTLFDVYSSIQAIFRNSAGSPITAAFPAYPYIQAASAAAFGFANLRKIMSAPTASASGGGGGAGGASFSGGGAVAAPTFTISGDSGQNQLADILNNQNREPVRAYVVSGEVTSQQQMDRLTEQNARFA